ncbi:MAG: aspartate carbamoyltransferase [Candidatus Brocadiia bacterium]
MSNGFKNVISIRDFDRDAIMSVLHTASEMERKPQIHLLDGYVLGIMFVEPSTRTRLSFASAMMQLGGSVLDFGDKERSSFKKGESLADTIRMIGGYCDILAIRHPWEGAARLAEQIAGIPVLNGGDGANQHPTQTFLDLYTIQKVHDKMNGLNVGFVGDLRYSRTVRSLSNALSHFEGKQYFISPESLKVPRHMLDELDKKKINYEEFGELPEIISELDILYCTRIQEERFADRLEYEQVKSSYRIDRNLLEECGVKDELKIMHPLPRVDELAEDVDETPYAVYFEQAKNGIPIRQALLAMALGKV